jgi:hypothetical protein
VRRKGPLESRTGHNPAAPAFSDAPLARLASPRNLCALVACLCCSAMAAAAVQPIADPDVWWVAAAGREAIAAHAVPRTNAFSFVEPLRPWVMHEWLFGPPYALALEWLGPPALVAIALVAAALSFVLVMVSTVGRSRHPSVGLGMAFATIAFFGGRFVSARPTGVSLVFPMMLMPLAFAPAFGPTSLLLTTLVELVWTNAHGSFPLGVVLLIVAMFEHTDDRLWRAAAVLASALVTCANPYGIALHRFVWNYFRGSEGIYREIHASITEFGDIAHAYGHSVGPVEVCGLLLIATLAAFAACTRSFRLRALTSLTLLFAASLHVRHVELAGILACFLLVPFVDSLAVSWKAYGVTSANWRRWAPAALVAPACVLGAGLFSVLEMRRTSEQWIQEGPSLLPLLARVPPGAHLFAPFDRAGLAIWYGFPRGVRVFYDSRNDCYSPETYRAFRDIETSLIPAAGVRAELERTGTDAMVVRDDQPLERFLLHAADWRLAQKSGLWNLYSRASETSSM